LHHHAFSYLHPKYLTIRHRQRRAKKGEALKIHPGRLWHPVHSMSSSPTALNLPSGHWWGKMKTSRCFPKVSTSNTPGVTVAATLHLHYIYSVAAMTLHCSYSVATMTLHCSYSVYYSRYLDLRVSNSNLNSF
jgi:hypothetical protein